MTPMDVIHPCVPPEELYPDDVAYMARTDLEQTRMLGYTPLDREAVTTVAMGIYGRRPTVRHRSGVTDEILRFFESAGVVIEEDMRVYGAEQAAEQHADVLIEEGYRLTSPYPLPEGRFPVEASLVDPDVYRRLNAKRNLSRLVPLENLATRQIVDVDDVSSRAFTGPVYAKNASDLATGWGHAVRYCETAAQLAEAARELTADGSCREVIVEEAIAVTTCWCVNLAVGHDRTLLLGAAEQLFSAPGQQSGSLIDPDDGLPPEGEALAVAIGERAGREGFVGIAALDIGRAADGRLVVFDPNFRLNASTSQVIYHASAVQRSGERVTASAAGSTTTKMSEVLAALEGPTQEGWFVPSRFLDGDLLDVAKGQGRYTGFVTGRDRSQALERARDIHARLAAG